MQDLGESSADGRRRSPALLMQQLALARAIREKDDGEAPAAPVPSGEGDVALAPDLVSANWARLRAISLNVGRLDRNRIIAAGRTGPAHFSFDVLRTKIVQPLAERGWKRVGITSPTKGCGKSFLALNLALSLSRYGDFRTVLMDMDLRSPAISSILGTRFTSSMGDFLRGHVAPESFFCRVGRNSLKVGPTLAFGLNNRGEDFASELFREPSTRESLSRLDASLAPHIVLFDLPPVLALDDVIALKPSLDCVLLVAGGGLTTPRELRETSHRLGDDLPILGVVLNKGEGESVTDYGT